jgi:hypothetical protein
MLDDGITAVLVRTAAPPGLVPRRHLNRTLQELQSHFDDLHHKYQFHVCGEGGEYETLVLDCPLYTKRLVLDDVEVPESEDGTGDLLILACHAEPKQTVTLPEQCVPFQDDPTAAFWSTRYSRYPTHFRKCRTKWWSITSSGLGDPR